jgi:hypothetical protein
MASWAKESGAGEDDGADHAAGARMFGAAADEADQQEDHEGGRDHRQPAGARSGVAGNLVTDADDVVADRAGAHASGRHRGIQLTIGEDVVAEHQIAAQDRQGSQAAEGGQSGFEQQQIE